MRIPVVSYLQDMHTIVIRFLYLHGNQYHINDSIPRILRVAPSANDRQKRRRLFFF